MTGCPRLDCDLMSNRSRETLSWKSRYQVFQQVMQVIEQRQDASNPLTPSESQSEVLHYRFESAFRGAIQPPGNRLPLSYARS